MKKLLTLIASVCLAAVVAPAITPASAYAADMPEAIDMYDLVCANGTPIVISERADGATVISYDDGGVDVYLKSDGTTTTTVTDIDDATDFSNYVIAGGRYADALVGNTSIIMTGGTVKAIIGSGYTGGAMVEGDVYVEVTGGTVTGGYSESTLNDIAITGAGLTGVWGDVSIKVSDAVVTGNIYGQVVGGFDWLEIEIGQLGAGSTAKVYGISPAGDPSGLSKGDTCLSYLAGSGLDYDASSFGGVASFSGSGQNMSVTVESGTFVFHDDAELESGQSLTVSAGTNLLIPSSVNFIVENPAGFTFPPGSVFIYGTMSLPVGWFSVIVDDSRSSVDSTRVLQGIYDSSTSISIDDVYQQATGFTEPVIEIITSGGQNVPFTRANGKIDFTASEDTLVIVTDTSLVATVTLNLDGGKLSKPDYWQGTDEEWEEAAALLLKDGFPIDASSLNDPVYIDGLPTPVKEGYTFDGWYFDSAFTQPAKMFTEVKDTTLYAKWDKDDPSTPGGDEGSKGDEGSSDGKPSVIAATGDATPVVALAAVLGASAVVLAGFGIRRLLARGR